MSAVGIVPGAGLVESGALLLPHETADLARGANWIR
jgi:hypothetical protein